MSDASDPMGLGAAYGGAGAADALRQLLLDRLAKQQSEHTQSIQDQDLALRQQQAAQSAKISDATLASLSDQRAASAATARETAAKGILAPLSIGDTIDPGAMPAVKAGNQMSLVNHQQAQPAMGDAFEGPMPAGQTAAAMPERDVYRGSDAQRTSEEQKQIMGRLVSGLPAGSKERQALEYEQATGKNAPTGLFDRTSKGQLVQRSDGTYQRVADDNTVEPVLDANGKPLAGYHPPAGNPDRTRLDHSYETQTKRLDVLEKPLADQAERIGRLSATINQLTPQADALIAPELLTAMAGGAGSGLRINEAEISRAVGGRSNWEGLKAALNAWQLDPTKALSVTPEQRKQMRALVQVIAQRGQSRLKLIDDARAQLVDAEDVTKHRRIVDAAKKALNDEGLGAAAAGNGPAAAGDTAHPPLQKYGATYEWDGTSYVKQGAKP